MVSSDFVHEWLGKPLKKPYSIATTNKELQEQWTIWFVVKKSREGYMSEYLTQGINIGDVLHLQGPVWHMVDDRSSSAYLLVSVWSGLSPMIGLYNAILDRWRKIAMLYGERFLNQVLPSTIELMSQNRENTICQLFFSREDDDFFQKNRPSRPVSQKGYVQDGLQEALDFLGTTHISVFLCWHPSMVDDVRERLTTHGIDPKFVKFEKY